MSDNQDKEQLEVRQTEDGAPHNPDEEGGQEDDRPEYYGEGKPKDRGAGLASYGNAAGEKIEGGLSKVGNPLGKGLGTVAQPVGGIVDPLLGGVMRFGKAHGEVAGVGYGNEDGKKNEENREMKKPIGGKDQTAENPLGL